MHQRVAELAALMNGPGRLRRDMAGNPARKGKLAKQPPHSVGVLRDGAVHLAVGAFQVRIGHQSGPPVAGPGDVDDVGVALANYPVQVRVDQIEAGGGAPVTQQPGFDVRGHQRFGQQWIVQQIDLTDRQVVGGAPIGVNEGQVVVGQGSGFAGGTIFWAHLIDCACRR